MAGILVGFFTNRRWTFAHRRDPGAAFIRYGALYAACFVVNLFLIWLFVDRLGFSAVVTQAVVVVIVALTTFLVQRSWVFQNR